VSSGSLMMWRAGAERRAMIINGERLRRRLKPATERDRAGGVAGLTSIAMGPA
jgi:hypothetical protein